MDRTRSQAIWFTVGLAVLCLALFARALGGDFLYDDLRTIVYNPSLRDPGNTLFMIVFERFRPLLNLSYALDYQLWGLRPWGYHLTNVLLHTANGVLLLHLLARTPGYLRTANDAARLRVAALAAVLFSVHPMTTQAVAYVSGRSELLCTTFVLLGLLAQRHYLASGNRVALGAMVVSLVLGLASKETAAMLPLAWWFYDCVLVQGPDPQRRLLRLYAPLMALVAIAALIRVSGYFAAETTLSCDGITRHWLGQSEVVWRYLRLLLFPVGQSVVHAVRELQILWSPLHWAGVAGLAGLVVLARQVRQEHPGVLFGLVWFLLFLAPSSLIPLSELMSEHRVYTASCGFALAAALLLHQAAAAIRTPRGLARAGGACLALALVAATSLRLAVWQDAVSLWQDAAKKAPGVVLPLAALGQAYHGRDRCDLAIDYYQQALTLLPTELRSRTNLGVCLAKLGRRAEAEAHFLALAKEVPAHVPAHNNLGTLARLRGDHKEARAHFERALELDPGNAIAKEQLAELARTRPP